jgi:hypothetical protein
MVILLSAFPGCFVLSLIPSHSAEQWCNGAVGDSHESPAQVTLDYWMLWSALMVGMGFGFTMLNNLGQFVEALGGGARQQGLYVLLFTTLNTVGRMVGGYVPERLLHARGTPRYGSTMPLKSRACHSDRQKPVFGHFSMCSSSGGPHLR